LAAISVGTESNICFVELITDLGLEISWQMLLLAELVSSMSKRALVEPFTETMHLPVLAHLSLKFLLVRFDKADSLRCIFKLLLRLCITQLSSR